MKTKLKLIGALILSAGLVFAADKKVSDLTALTSPNWASGDLFPIVDVSASETKKTTVGDFDLRYFLNVGTLGIANGGTGQTTANAALNALLPSQTSNAGKLLQTDGTSTAWVSAPATGVTSVASGNGLSGGPITSNGTLSVLADSMFTFTSGTLGITQSSGSSNGYLSSTDWTTFNNKIGSMGGTSPITVSGTLVSIAQSSGSSNGYLSSTDWTTFNNKQATIGGSTPITVSGTLVSIVQSSGSSNGYLSSTDWTTFNSKQATMSGNAPILVSGNSIAITQAATAANGYLSSTDWNTFNNKQSALLTAKGDLLLGNGTSTSRLGVGANDTVMTADSTTATGVKWAAAGTASPLTTKGDIYTYSATNDRLAKGNNYQVLSGSSTATGLAWRNEPYQNLLVNPSFEASANGQSWTLSAGSSVADTSSYIDGDKSMNVSVSAVNGAVMSQSVIPLQSVQGTNLEVSIWTKTASSLFQACSTIAGATYQCATVASDNYWHQNVLNIPGPAAGSSVGVLLQTTSSTTGSIGVDGGYIGAARNIGLLTPDTDWAAYTPSNSQGFGTITSVEIQWRRVGQDALIRGSFTTGTVAASEAQIALPSGLTSAGTSIIPSIQLAGYFTSAGAFAGSFTTLIEPSKTYMTFGLSGAGTAGLSKANGNGIANNTTKYTFFARIPIDSWSSQISVRPNTPVLPTIQKFTTGTGTYTTPAGVSHIRVRMVGGGGGGGGGTNNSGGSNGGDGGNTTFGTTLLAANGGKGGTKGTNAVGPGVGGAGGTASLGAGPIGTAISGGAGSTSQNQLNPGGLGASTPFGSSGPQGGLTVASPDAGANTGAGAAGGPSGTTGNGRAGGGGGAGGYVESTISNPLTTYSYAVGAAGTAGTGQGTTEGAAGGAGGSGYIEVTEYYQQVYAPLLVGSVTSGTSGAERIERARISAATTCGITSQSGSWISSTSSPGSNAQCTINFATGTFSATPSCTCSAEISTTGFTPTCWIMSVSSTSMLTNVYDQTASNKAEPIDIICMGPK